MGTNHKIFKLYLGLSISTLAFSGCATFKKFLKTEKKTASSPAKKSAAPTQHKVQPRPAPVDAQAQQRHYDLGLRHYSEENYSEAKKSWQQVIQMGSGTPLAEKAREYLKKTDQILKTLKEIESR